MQKHRWLCSSIGRKQLIALTGLGLSLFVLVHMSGNLLLFKSAQAYNEYSHSLTSNPLIYLAEGGLVVLFLGHLLFALKISWSNYRARPRRYAVCARGEKGTSAVAKTLWAQGVLIFIFVIIHLKLFKYGTYYAADYGHGPIRDLHKLIMEEFHEPAEVVWYVFAVSVLGFHLSHGIGSSLQTFGINHPRYSCCLKRLSHLFGLAIAAGFASQPLYVYFFQ